MEKFLGAFPPLSLIQGVIHQIWGRCDRVNVIPLKNGLFLFKFENPQTCAWVLEGGPWFVAQRPLLLKKWTPGISLEKFSFSTVLLGINIRGLPMVLFTNDGISHIASGVEIPLFMDKATELRTRISFARVCIEVAQGAPLSSSIQVEIKDFF